MKTKPGIKILCTPQRGAGDLIHILPLIHSLGDAFGNPEIIIPVVDRYQGEQSRSFGDLFEGVFTFDYHQIKDDLEKRRIHLLKSRSFNDKYQTESEERKKFEQELYEEYLGGEEYDLVIVPRRFQIRTISCRQQITLNDLDNISEIHMVDRHLRFAEYLGIPKKIEFRLDQNKLSTPPVDNYGKLIELPDNYITIILSSSRLNKRWTIEGNKELTRYCIKKGYVPVLMASEDDYEYSKSIETERTINLTANKGFLVNLENFSRIAKQSKAVVGPDTGLTHIADAAGTKVVGLYGPSRPSKFAPYNNKHLIVSTNHTTQLMSDIKHEEVIGKLEEALSS